MAVTGLVAQIDESKRYDEEGIAKETRFVNAAQLQLLAKYDEAIELYESILKEDGESAIVYFQLSRCYEAIKDIAKAIDSAKKSVQLDQQNEYFSLQLADVYEANQEFSEAANTYLAYAQKHEDQLFFYERAVYFFLKSKDYDQAIFTLNKMEKLQGIQEAVSKQKFEIYSKSGQSKKALKELQKLSKAYPTKEKYKLGLANYYLQLGQMSKAKDIFRTILKDDPSNETALRYMELSNAPASNDEVNYLKAVSADIPNMSISLDQKIAKIVPSLKSLLKQHNVALNEELIRVTMELCQVYPDDAKPLALLGDAYMQSGQYDEAIKAYKSTIKLNGAVFDVWYQLMIAQKNVQDFDDLLATSDQALLRFPNQAMSYLFHGFALNKSNQAKDALDILDEGMSLTAGDRLIANNIRVERARSQYLLEDYEKALALLETEALATAEYWEIFGDIKYQQGQIDTAVEHWKKALKYDPKNERLVNKVNQKQI